MLSITTEEALAEQHRAIRRNNCKILPGRLLLLA